MEKEFSALPGWRIVLVSLLLGFVCLFALYWETAMSMVAIWRRSDTFAHGFIILPFSGYLIWQLRYKILSISPKPSPWGLLILIMLVLAWLLSDLAGVIVTKQFAFVAMIPALVITVLGWQIARVCSFPLIYLFFAVPFGEFLIYPMMRVSTIMSAAMLSGIGIPLNVEGVEIFLATTTWNVAEGCSGLRYLIASTALGTAYAFLFYQSIFRRVIFVIASIVVPLLANWLRVFIIVWLGHISGGKLSTGFDHIIYGWVLFVVVILILFWVGMYWREDSEEEALRGKGVNVASTAFSNWTVNVFVGLALGVIAIGPLWAQAALQPKEMSANWRLEPPAAHGSWQTSELQMTDWRPMFVNEDDELFSTYVNGDKMVGLHIAYYRQQNQGKEVVSSSNRMIEDNQRIWSRGLQKSITINLDDTSLKARMTLLKGRRDNRCLQTTDWYWVEGHSTSNWLVAKRVEVFDKLLGGHGSGAGIVVVVNCAEGKEEAVATTAAFLSEMLPSIEVSLDNVLGR